jgi:hypothetical protein
LGPACRLFLRRSLRCQRVPRRARAAHPRPRCRAVRRPRTRGRCTSPTSPRTTPRSTLAIRPSSTRPRMRSSVC